MHKQQQFFSDFSLMTEINFTIKQCSKVLQQVLTCFQAIARNQVGIFNKFTLFSQSIGLLKICNSSI